MTQSADYMALVDQLDAIHNKLSHLVKTLRDEEYRQQFDPNLSPVGWHLGHILFVENFWLQTSGLKKNSYTKEAADLYIPENSIKSERGKRLPPKKQMLDQAQEHRTANLNLLTQLPSEFIGHPLLKDNYLLKFLLQHHTMHFETMCAILIAKNKAEILEYTPKRKLTAKPVQIKTLEFPSGVYSIGASQSECFDNEKPSHHRRLDRFAVNCYAVSNSEFLSFIDAGGYQTKQYWSHRGWGWCQQQAIFAPHTWQKNNDSWYLVNEYGAEDLVPDQAVYGISQYEANAFAHWARGRLPHEHELEVAWQTPNKLIPSNTWEWCHNTFYPYDGYKSFPYPEYSTPWFNKEYYTLKGYSPHVVDMIRRPSFRNFYTADRRHTYMGIRLAFDE